MTGANVGYYMFKLIRSKASILRDCSTKEELLTALKKINDHNEVLKDIVEEIFMP